MPIYNPLEYATRRRTPMADFGQILSGMIGKLPEAKLRDDAIAQATKDWKAMEDSWKVAKNMYTKKAQKLVDQGLMTEQEMNANLQKFRPPTQADKQNPSGYLDGMRSVIDTSFGDLRQRTRQSGLTEAVGTAMRPRFGEAVGAGTPEQIQRPTGEQFTEETITTRPTMFLPSNALSGETGSRPNRSSGLTALSSEIFASPLIISARLGIVLISTERSSRSSTISRRRARLILGMASKTAVAPVLSSKLGI